MRRLWSAEREDGLYSLHASPGVLSLLWEVDNEPTTTTPIETEEKEKKVLSRIFTPREKDCDKIVSRKSSLLCLGVDL